MSNLVMGVGVGYTVEQLEPFVVSLRKHYNDDVILFVDTNNESVISFLEQNDVMSVPMPPSLREHVQICNERHKVYRDFLQSNFKDVERILICDVRDVIFQDDPFKHKKEAELEFFCESELIKNDECNGPWWMGGTYGQEVLDHLGNNLIICAGTTIGTRDGMLLYLNELINEIDRMIVMRGQELQKTRPVVDQVCHNFLIYTGKFPSHKLYKTGYGPIATMSFERDYLINSDGVLQNRMGNIPSVVHQWDRTKEKDLFLRKAVS
jgi:hypothetical protein